MSGITAGGVRRWDAHPVLFKGTPCASNTALDDETTPKASCKSDAKP